MGWKIYGLVKMVLAHRNWSRHCRHIRKLLVNSLVQIDRLNTQDRASNETWMETTKEELVITQGEEGA